MSEPAGDLARFGWNGHVGDWFGGLDGATLAPGRVVRVERSNCVVVRADGRETIHETRAAPGVGDWVAVGDVGIEEVLPRWSALTRTDPSGVGTQVLAANVDLVLITAPADRLNPARVERELAVAWDSGAQPLVVLTKSDLATEATWSELQGRLAGVEVLAISATTDEGVDDLRQRLKPDRTAVFLGPSGAGKSTLANALIGTEVLATGVVREGDSRGRHTTTSRQLLPLPSGGVLIDTPGLRSLGLAVDIEIGAAFPDINTLGEGCRFANCRHEVEPDCAVIVAAKDGSLNQRRLESYRNLQREVAVEPRRTVPTRGRPEPRVPRRRRS